MVHKMDSMSSKYRDDPVRAVLEKKQNREAAADRLAQANAMAAEILQKRLNASASTSATNRARLDDEDDSTRMSDADYRQLLERQREKLMGDDDSSSSSNISVYDPFMSRRVPPPAAHTRTRARPRTQPGASVLTSRVFFGNLVAVSAPPPQKGAARGEGGAQGQGAQAREEEAQVAQGEERCAPARDRSDAGAAR